MYLNEIISSNKSSKVDDEIIYAGLHDAKIEKKNFKRSQKFSTKYTKRRQAKRKKKGRFG